MIHTVGARSRRYDTPLQRAVALAHGPAAERGLRLLLSVVRADDPEAGWACLQLVQLAFERGLAAATEHTLLQTQGIDTALRDLGVGSLYRRAGRLIEAGPPLERSFACAGSLAAELELAGLEAATGRTSEALRRVARADARARARGDAWGIAAAAAQMAGLAIARGDLADAIMLADRSARIRASLGDRIGLGFAHQLRAKALYRMGAYAPALAALDDARVVHVDAEHHLESAVVLNNIGLWHLDLASPLRAVDEFRAARSFFRRLGDTSREAAVLANLANAYRQLGELTRAAQTYRRALTLLRRAADGDACGIAVAELAEVETRRDRPRAALTLVTREERRNRTVSTGTAALLELERARGLLRLDDPTGARQSASKALRMVARSADERTKVSCAVRAGLVQAHAQLDVGKTQAAAATLARTRDRLDALVTRQHSAWVRVGLVEAFRETHDLLVRSLLGPELRGAHRAWQEVAGFKARELSVGRDHGDGPPTGTTRHAPEARAAEVTLLEYHVGGDTTYVFVVEGGRVRAIDLGVSEVALQTAVAALVEPMRRAGASGDARADLFGFELAAAKRLYDLVLEPALAARHGTSPRIIVVPDGPLHALPFELLVRRLGHGANRYTPSLAAYDRATYVLDELDVSYARSSRLVGAPRHQPVSRRFLGLSFSPPRPTLFPTPDGMVRLEALRRAAAEVATAAATFASATTRHGRAATVAAWTALAPSADLIHIAAHAFADSRAPGLSGVLLSGRGVDGALPAGYLSAESVRRIPLRASLVTLSGCNSAWGALRAREGVFGLTRSFLEAGADAVVSSLWSVDDDTAYALMQGFYEHLAAGQTRAAALASTKRDLRNALGRHLVPQRAHPYFWAPFVLVDHRPERLCTNVARSGSRPFSLAPPGPQRGEGTRRTVSTSVQSR